MSVSNNYSTDDDTIITASNKFKTIISFTAEYLLDQIEKNEEKQNKSEILKEINIFYSKSFCSITIYQLLEDIYKYLELDNSTIILSIIYLNRFCLKGNIDLNIGNVHKYV